MAKPRDIDITPTDPKEKAAAAARYNAERNRFVLDDYTPDPDITDTGDPKLRPSKPRRIEYSAEQLAKEKAKEKGK